MSSLKEFEFPLSDINDLKVTSDDHYYVEVKDAPARSSLPSQQNVLTDIEDRLTRHPLQLFSHENFDPLFMLIIKLKSLKTCIKQRLVEVFSNIAVPLLNKVNSSVDSMERRRTCRNSIKMLSFLLCVVVRTLEREARSQAESASLNKLAHGRRAKKSKRKKKRRKKGEEEEDGEYEWREDKERVLAILCDVLRQKKLVKLWDMNSPSELFGNLFFNTAMAALENGQNHHGAVAKNVIQAQILDLIGLSLSRYATNVCAASQLIRMLQTSQWHGSDNKLAGVVAQLISVVGAKYKRPMLLHEMLTYFLHFASFLSLNPSATARSGT